MTLIAFAQNTPSISKLSPSGKYFIEDLYAAGWCICGVETLLAENGRLHTDCKTVALKTQGEIAEAAHVVDEDLLSIHGIIQRMKQVVLLFLKVTLL